MKLHLASANPHKADEFAALARAAGFAVEVLPAGAAGMPEVPEDTGTFVGNARQKAAALRDRLGPEAWILADDSGLCVDALDGAPGVESAYYAGRPGNAAANLARLVERLHRVPGDRRTARFVCVLVLLGPGGSERVVEGRSEGRLLEAPRGGAGFGYDPLFVPEGSALTFAEMPEADKNARSHRGTAWRSLLAALAAEGRIARRVD